MVWMRVREGASKGRTALKGRLEGDAPWRAGSCSFRGAALHLLLFGPEGGEATS
jgi:hypothetical protein